MNEKKSLYYKFSQKLSAIFGTLKWTSPFWLNNLKHKSQQSPKLFWGAASLLIALIIASGIGLYCYQHRVITPKITATITVPDITPMVANDEPLTPGNLIIDFGIKKKGFKNESVAPLSLIGKTLTQGIQIQPKITGQWNWNNDSQLIFIPEEDWSAGQKYTIHFEKDFFNTPIPIESYDVSFTTKPLETKIKEFKLYQDPVKPEVRNAVATIYFNYPVNPQSLEKNTTLIFQTLKKGKLDPNAKSLKFTYTLANHNRMAYLHSETIKIKDTARYLLLTLNKPISSFNESNHLEAEASTNLMIPDASNFLNIASASASIIRNNKDRPEQVLSIETSLGVNEKEFNKAIHLYLLPKDYPATAKEEVKKNYQWQNPGEINETILSLSTALNKEMVPTEHNYSSLHSYKFATETPRYLYLKIDKGMKGFGGFTLKNDYTAVIAIPDLPKEISFLHKGSLLALSEDKKLSVLVRGLPSVKFNFARVLPSNLNQLVTQTQGDFNNPYFINPSFNEQNISQIFSEIKEFDTSDLTKQQYTALDLGKYLNTETNLTGPQGLFLLQALGWDSVNNAPLDIKTTRLILVTDLGMVVKDNHDGSHDVFINSITQGGPVSNVTVSVLGKNGLALISKVSDSEGRVTFPALKDFVEDKEPCVYLASLNSDVSFIPFNNYNRQLNFSKFDIGGLYTSNQDLQSLSAYLFSDRGIYRPGDTVHIGMIVKQAYAEAQQGGLPLQISVVDSRGTTIKDQKITLSDTGYMELDFTPNANAPTGQYTVNLFLVKDAHPQNLLGSTSVQVAEFQPDRMRISSQLIPTPSDGWTSPAHLKAQVDLINLYGAPAANRKIQAKILLTPQAIKWPTYPEYIFADPLQDPEKPARVFTETLSELKTNDKGQAEFNLNLEQFEKATYQLTFFAEGFEAEGGRSVATQTKVLISPLSYFIGYKPDGDLSFIKQNSQRGIHFIAINPQLRKEAIADLKVQLFSLHPITSLIKNANDGTYQYQSIMQSTLVNTSPLNLKEEGNLFPLPTEQVGTYVLKIIDKDNTILSQLKFNIVGASQQPLAKNAELDVKLNKSEYKAGEDIVLQISSPYTGAGLITIERDKVYTSHWFKTDTTNSVQTIRLPADFKGNGYINVAFIRAWDSPELFISPLSYAVIPFSVNHEDQDIKITLDTPKLAKPGHPLKINYQTDKPGKIIVFAVDEGILQVNQYKTPDPLAFFFQKKALEVLTQQTVDQILPKFIQDRELSAAGGDDGEATMAGKINPFKRKTDLPVAYWSGIIDSDTQNHELIFNIPDYFNGSLKIMAVAVSADALGSKDTSTQVRGDFIINPNVPTFVAPGDEFEISSSIANNIKDSGEHTPINVAIEVSPELEIIGATQQTLEIAEGKEASVHFRIRAKAILGSANITFKANAQDKVGSMKSSLSVRPAMPFVHYVDSGVSQNSQQSLDVMNTLYLQYRKAEVSLSTNPLILVFGLQNYLDNYPYGCTEQLTSKVFPLLAMQDKAWFAKDKDAINEKVNTGIQLLSQRQMAQGSFSYWPGLGENTSNDFSSVYAMHFLTIAKNQGYNVPEYVFSNGLSYLKQLASQNAKDINAARIQAYAIYILTLNELVTTNYIANLQIYLQNNEAKTWQQDIAAVYIAASYQLLKNTEDAQELIKHYQPDTNQNTEDDFYDPNINKAQYLYILATHFPELLANKGNALLMNLIKSMNTNEINTLLSSYISLALNAYAPNDLENSPSSLSITEILDNNQEQKQALNGSSYQKLDINEDVKKLQLHNPNKQTFFYQLIQAGFNKELPTTPFKKGIEIYREYRDEKGNVLNSTPLGSEIEVHIRVKTLDNQYLAHIVIEDLLPGGFEVIRDSVKTDLMDYADVREDRVNYFGSLDENSKHLVYKIKATNPGTYKVPPVYAEAMYDPGTKALGVGAEITVTKAP